MIKTIGIVGFGSFGQTLAQALAPHTSVLVSSRRPIEPADLPKGVKAVSFEETAACDVVILTDNLATLEATAKKIKPFLSKDTLVMDVCSVKVKPAEILQRILGDSCQLLATHPLFGPQSMSNNGGTKGLIVVWHELSRGPFDELKALFTDDLGLKILEVDPDFHDKDMAWVHGLTFFVGRALLNINPPESKLATHYYNELMDLVIQEKQHSYELFMTIQQGNPYADDIRKKFVESLESLESEIMKERG